MKVPYQAEILLTLKILIPVTGILAFNWSIGMIFLYFLLELLFIGGETIIKMLCSALSSFWQKIGGIFRFLVIYSLMVLFIVVLAGHFFDGGGAGNMEAHFDKQMVYFLVAVYVIDILIGFIFPGRFKRVTSREVENETYKLLGVLFMTLALFLFLMWLITTPSQTNYVLGIGIIAARNFGEYLLTRKLV